VDSTAWTVIRGAAAGEPEHRSLFVRSYSPVIRAYLRARWRASPLLQEVDDAVQEVFLACFKEDGVLDAADPSREFRPFLYGVVRNVARHAETRRVRNRERPLPADLEPASEEELSAVFDRAWALAIVQAALQRVRDPKEVELLRLRFHEDLPIREIARRWGVEPEQVHRAYAGARRSYENALIDVVLFHQHSGHREALQEARRLLELLG